MGSKPDPLWRHTSGVWLLDMGLQVAMVLFFLLVAWRRLERLSPGRRK